MSSIIKAVFEVVVGVVALIAVAGIIATQSAGSVGSSLNYTVILLIPTIVAIGLLYGAAKDILGL